MEAIKILRKDVLIANMARLEYIVKNVLVDLEYFEVDCEEEKLDGGEFVKVGLESEIKELRLLNYLGLIDYLIGNPGTDEYVFLTPKGKQLYNELNAEGAYQK